jgi:N-acetylneuraminic acid mutarotase
MITDKWFRLGDLPFDKYTWKGLTINSEGYVLLPNGLWRYNPLTSIWTELTAFPDTRRFSPGIFSISDKIYLGAGVTPGNNRYNILKDFWEYSVESNSWIQKNDFPGAPRASPIAFSIGANGYMGAGEFDGDFSCCYNDVWQYDADSDSWQTISSFPLPYAEFGGYFRMVTTALNDEMYVGLGSSGIQGETNNHIYKYNSVSEEWIRIEDYPSRSDNSHFDGVAFTVDNQAFFGSGAYPDVLWSYDGSRWNAQKSQTRAGRNSGFSFVINNIAYLGGGADFNQFWSFDPSQPD